MGWALACVKSRSAQTCTSATFGCSPGKTHVALGVSQSVLGEWLRTGHTRLLQRNETIQFVAVGVFVDGLVKISFSF